LFAAQLEIVANAEKLGEKLRMENGVEKAVQFINSQILR
jgi:hypothetical protein